MTNKFTPSRRQVIQMVLGAGFGMGSRIAAAAGQGSGEAGGRTEAETSDALAVMPSRVEWEALDEQVRSWWPEDLISATEEVIRADPEQTTLFLPHPYLRISPNPRGVYQWQFPFDTAFMNWALLAHNRSDIALCHILNHLALIDRFGFAPNANSTQLITRSQTPLMPLTVWSYYRSTRELDLLLRAYPLFKHEYNGYWKAPHHQTPTGLATNRDLGDMHLSPELASEAELLDWMPVFGGDIRRCVPIATNCALVGYARVLAMIAREIGCSVEAIMFDREADERSALIRHYCWNENKGLFLEYDWVAGKQLPYVSECSYWTLWSGVATTRQALRLAGNIHLLEKTYGLSSTDRHYSDPHAASVYEVRNIAGPYHRLQDFPPMPDAPREYIGGRDQLMWAYPAGFGSTQILVTAGLDRYGWKTAARRISAKYLGLLIEQYRRTGQLWEKYNVVDGSLVLPNARYGNIPYHSLTAAAVVLLGRRAFGNRTIRIL